MLKINKRHSWRPVFSPHGVEPQFYKHYKCNHCGLEKATTRVGSRFSTFYFESDGHGVIKRYGVDHLRVPYGCGEVREMILEDELFEI